MSEQEIKNIKISNLHLWTENPRDPVDLNKTDKEIIQRAINNSRWELDKLINDMGSYYDFSELPTVVLINGKYIVYDGNRRIAVIKCLQNPQWNIDIEEKLLPINNSTELENLTEIPCNVCDQGTALNNIERKHIKSSSWGELERHYFLYKHRKNEKSNFLIIEESAGLISADPKMNQRFVNDEVFTEENLQRIGFSIEGEKLVSNYKQDFAKEILQNIVTMIASKKISTRGKNRRKLKEPLEEGFPLLKGKIKEFNHDEKTVIVPKLNNQQESVPKARKTKRENEPKLILFGESLNLRMGTTNDMYRDIDALYQYYEKNKDKDKLSRTFPNIIRMSLRLLVELASKDEKKDEQNIEEYIKENFDNAKRTLTQDEKTTLHTYNIDISKKLIELLNIGAHNYSVSSDINATIAISIIVGAMLKVTHSKTNGK